MKSKIRLAFLAGALLTGPAGDTMAQETAMYDYWILPYGRALSRWTVRWNGCAGEQSPTLDVRNYAWWRGSLWDRSIYLQSHPATSTYDVYADSNNQLEYWGSFRGNAFTIDSGGQPGDSSGFAAPFMWMPRRMSVGQVMQQPVTVKLLKAGGRYDQVTSTITMRLRFVSHMPTFFDSESGLTWDDVIKLEFWSDYRPADPNYNKETYWQVKNIGTIRFETTNCGEPSGVKRQYAAYYEDGVAMASPLLPWFDPTSYLTFVRNGFMERFQVPNPPVGSPVTGTLVSWSGEPDRAN